MRGARLIPARAGNTTYFVANEWTSSAHPRSRGEHYGFEAVASRVIGSSPLARGTRKVSGPFPSFFRLIPARAGNTVLRESIGHAPAAHPRSRGEHAHCAITAGRRHGSSPLARGTRNEISKRVKNGRLIPARAGNTGRRRGE